MEIRKARAGDSTSVLSLYRAVAEIPGGLARLESELDADYIDGFLAKSIENGLCLVALADGESEETAQEIIAEIHAYKPPLFCFSHVLSDLTIAVHPNAQGSGVGRELFEEFMTQVRDGNGDIGRVELIARESNGKAIAFYHSLGFEIEGAMRGRIQNLDGSVENDIPMAWTRG